MAEQKVIIYSTSWCGFCRSEKQYLDGKNVSYIDKDVEKDATAQKELLEKMNGNFQGVPVTDIGGDIILGFDRPKIDDALKKHGLV
ncbi:NrdH-redoxin [Candidatus Saccharibacteria bacterium]|nr:NrdH-redoxin [Candidatus Saccharibacteria bacterium]